MQLKRYQERLLREVKQYLDLIAAEQADGNEDTTYKRSVATYFEKVGRKVPWQKLAEEFEDHQFRFQILDEGDYADRDWRDDLKKLLEDEATE